MHDNFKLRKIVATILLVVLLGIIAYALYPYINAFLSAGIIYYLFRPFYSWLAKRMKRGFAAGIVLLVVMLIIVIPFTVATSVLVNEASHVVFKSSDIVTYVDVLDNQFPQLHLISAVNDFFSNLGQLLRAIVLSILGNIANLVINIVIFFFVLFYMLVNTKTLVIDIHSYIPFKAKNRKILVKEFQNITYTTIVSTGLIAFMQGVFLALGLWLFGFPSPIFWGVIGMVFSFLPVIGISFIWIPVGILSLVSGNIVSGVGILIWGTIISNVDNVLRPWLQNSLGKLHPLITLIGVFIGIPLFGLLGLLIGPLLLSYGILITKMYIEEYVK